MFQPERPDSATGIGITFLEGLVPDPYVQEFEERFAALHPLFDYQTPRVKFDMEDVGLQPDKFTAAIFLNREDSFEILLGQKDVSGYFQEDHWAIADEHPEAQDYPTLKAKPAFISAMGGLRFAMIDSFRLWEEDVEDVDKLKDTLKRYGIAMAFSVRDGEIEPLLDDLGQGVLSVSQYQQVMDKVIFDGWTNQVAQNYGLTNTEYIRLRLQGELPRDKQKPKLDSRT